MSKRSVFVAFLQRFARRKDGAAAIEMAVVAIPFFSLIFAIFEVALIYLGTSSLDNGLTSAARQIRTGQAQSSNMTATQFRQLVCDRITPLLACDSRLVIDVRRFSSFGGIVVPPPLDGTGNFAGGNVFQSGAAGDIIVAVGREPVRTQAEFYRKVWSRGSAGAEITLRVLQDVDIRDVRVKSIDRVEYFRAVTTY